MEKVSVLLPTRKRFEQLIKSVESLFQNCNNIDNIEILLGLDNDDVDTINKVNSYIKNQKNIKIYIYERFFYKNLHKYYNNLIQNGTGTSFLLWNDDAIMKSKNWDLEIINNQKEFCVLSPKHNHLSMPSAVLFPVLPKKWLELTDIWSPYRGCDSWIDFLSKKLNVVKHIDTIIIEHDRHDITGNNKDETYIEGRIGGEDIMIYKNILESHYEIIKKYLDDNN